MLKKYLVSVLVSVTFFLPTALADSTNETCPAFSDDNHFWWWGMMGYNWFFNFFPMFIFWLVLIIAAIWFFYKYSQNNNGGVQESPQDILKKRLAKGEISKEEFDELMESM